MDGECVTNHWINDWPGQFTQFTSFLCHLLLSSVCSVSWPLLMWPGDTFFAKVSTETQTTQRQSERVRHTHSHTHIAPVIVAVFHSSHLMLIKCTVQLPVGRPLVTGQSFSSMSWAVMQVNSDQHTLKSLLLSLALSSWRAETDGFCRSHDHLTGQPSQLTSECVSEYAKRVWKRKEEEKKNKRGRGKWPEKT